MSNYEIQRDGSRRGAGVEKNGLDYTRLWKLVIHVNAPRNIMTGETETCLPELAYIFPATKLQPRSPRLGAVPEYNTGHSIIRCDTGQDNNDG